MTEPETSKQADSGKRDSSHVRALNPVKLSLIVVILVVAGSYGLNCWINLQALGEVRALCGMSEEQIDRTISDLRDQEAFSSDWMLSVHQARRIYLREICDSTVFRLTWWRWNLLRPVEVRLSTQAEEDIERILVRTGSSCESEIRDNERAFEREMERQQVSPQVEETIRSMIAGQYASCRELGQAVDGGAWPPLTADGPSKIPESLRVILPGQSESSPSAASEE